MNATDLRDRNSQLLEWWFAGRSSTSRHEPGAGRSTSAVLGRLWRLSNETALVEAELLGAGFLAPRERRDLKGPWSELTRLVHHLDCGSLLEEVNQLAGGRYPQPVGIVAGHLRMRLGLLAAVTQVDHDRVMEQALMMSVTRAVDTARCVLEDAGSAVIEEWFELLISGHDPERSRAQVLVDHGIDPDGDDPRLAGFRQVAFVLERGRCDRTPVLYAGTTRPGAGRVQGSLREALIRYGSVARSGNRLMGVLPRAVAAWIERTYDISSETRMDVLTTPPLQTKRWRAEDWETALLLWPDFGTGPRAADAAIAAAEQLAD